jgi:hypothetical protein
MTENFVTLDMKTYEALTQELAILRQQVVQLQRDKSVKLARIMEQKILFHLLIKMGDSLDKVKLVLLAEVCDRIAAQIALEAIKAQTRLFIKHTLDVIPMFDPKMNDRLANHPRQQNYNLGDQNITERSHEEMLSEIPDYWKAIYRRCLVESVETSEEVDGFTKSDQS